MEQLPTGSPGVAADVEQGVCRAPWYTRSRPSRSSYDLGGSADGLGLAAEPRQLSQHEEDVLNMIAHTPELTCAMHDARGRRLSVCAYIPSDTLLVDDVRRMSLAS
ncbi:hypothetical protein KFE25_003840 [Diacronema lutheri]|uniref:Uncharacterized protein n=1 Tax=Diacronema lutheri TaxID=2081491 RepID=A0A8J6C6H8_DIALT|nr:hypothetical protein KFE25_003840 [Diacronema lutheri]